MTNLFQLLPTAPSLSSDHALERAHRESAAAAKQMREEAWQARDPGRIVLPAAEGGQGNHTK